MNAVTFSKYGGPEVLEVSEIEEPHAGQGQVRIRVAAAGLNPFDWKVRSGMFAQGSQPESPIVDGREAAGVVDEVGDGVTDTQAGDEVFGWAVGGAAAEYAVLDAWEPKPAQLSFEEAAGLPVAVETPVRVFSVLGGLHEGQTILINGAAGGVGAMAVQFAKARGARVIGTASERNHDYLRELGAEPTTYGEGLVERVRELAPEGVDLAFDTAGKGDDPGADRADRRPGPRGHDRRLRRRPARREGLRRRRGTLHRGAPRGGGDGEAGPPARHRRRDVSVQPRRRRPPPEPGGPRAREDRAAARLSRRRRPSSARTSGRAARRGRVVAQTPFTATAPCGTSAVPAAAATPS